MDYRKLQGFCSIYTDGEVDDGYGGSTPVTDVLVAEMRCMKRIKSKSSQSQTQGGVFDFYQVYEFTIRDNPNYDIKKDMTLKSDGDVYTIRGIVPSETNPRYITLVTEKK